VKRYPLMGSRSIVERYALCDQMWIDPERYPLMGSPDLRLEKLCGMFVTKLLRTMVRFRGQQQKNAFCVRGAARVLLTAWAQGC
jgi:hypothetical protein